MSSDTKPIVISIIGTGIAGILVVGGLINGVNNRIDDLNATVNTRIDDVNATVNTRIDDVNTRVDTVQTDIRELRALVIEAIKADETDD